jgi:hypothetical protein
LVIVRKRVNTNMCVIPDVYRDGAVWISRAKYPYDFCLWDWMKSEVYKRKANTPDELLARISDAAEALRYVKTNSDEEHAIFTHELQKSICHFCVTNVI